MSSVDLSVVHPDKYSLAFMREGNQRRKPRDLTLEPRAARPMEQRGMDFSFAIP